MSSLVLEMRTNVFHQCLQLGVSKPQLCRLHLNDTVFILCYLANYNHRISRTMTTEIKLEINTALSQVEQLLNQSNIFNHMLKDLSLQALWCNPYFSPCRTAGKQLRSFHVYRYDFVSLIFQSFPPSILSTKRSSGINLSS